MGKINWGRVLLGGVIWSVVYTVLWTASWYLFLKDEWEPTLVALGRPFQETASFLALFLLLVLMLGIFAIWFYAAIRPRYGPGPKTAACAGFGLWLVSALVPTVAWGERLSFPPRVMVISLAVSLVGVVAATLLGAWPYKEE